MVMTQGEYDGENKNKNKNSYLPGTYTLLFKNMDFRVKHSRV